MAIGRDARSVVRGLLRVSMTTADANRLAAFYEAALGFRRLATTRLVGAAFEKLMGVDGGAASVRLRLGNETIELLQFDNPAHPYPRDASSSDLVFQHFAIVVANIDEAYRRLSAVSGWTAISHDGPQRLPAASGGVTAFKFRDPEGHPLELLSFAEGRTPARWAGAGGRVFLGIDHSAIGVSDVARSIAFYEGHGLAVSARSLNRGAEQERLDNVRDPVVDVVALAPPRAHPHLELLHYKTSGYRAPLALSDNDVAATRLVLDSVVSPAGDENPPEASSREARSIRDPDGHHLVIV